MKRILTIFLTTLMIILMLAGCGGTNSNDGKCDICGKSKYAKLSDGNEYCYTHWKSAIDYYLDD